MAAALPQARNPASVPTASIPPGSRSFDLAEDPSETAGGAFDEEEDGGALEFDLLGATSKRGDTLWGTGADAFDYPEQVAAEPQAFQLEQPVPRTSVRPPAGLLDGSLPDRRASVPPKRSSFPPPMAAQASVPPPSLGLPLSSAGAADWDLDEALGLAPSMDLVVAVPMPSDTTSDGPWPHGRTPLDDELSISKQQVDDAAGFGQPPGSFLTAPLYFLRVFFGKKQVQVRLDESERALAAAEFERDQILANLGEKLRPELGENDRFSRLYLEIDKYEALIAERARSLAQADVSGESTLSAILSRLEQARAAQEALEASAVQERAVHTEADRLVRRARAQSNRLEIEVRNVQELARERAGDGAVMPQDLALRYVALENELKAARAALAAAAADFKLRAQSVRQAEDAERRAHADADRIEGEKEGYMSTHEGDMTSHAGLLDQARSGRVAELARAARAVLELRGEVTVEAETRLQIAEHDRVVEVAAHRAGICRRALGSADESAYATGRFIWIALTVAALASLVITALAR